MHTPTPTSTPTALPHIPEGEVWKFYYGVYPEPWRRAGAQRVAVRSVSSVTSSLNYLLSDHLGSTSITVSPTGNQIAEMRYDAFGNTRYTQGETLTDYQYTGQRFESGIGLYYYNARWYDPALGRFAQADTVIPPGVQGYDRYVYVNNNPLNATDPTGHTSCSDIPNEQARQYCLNQGGLPGFGDDSGYVNNGNDVNNENDGGGGTLTPTPTPTTNLPPTPKPIVDSPNSSPAPLPSTITFHPLDGNVVSQVPIYDYSWFPPKLIGYRITSYGIDAVHFNPMDFIFPSDALTFTSVIHSYILTPLMEGGIQNLASVGIDVSCPVCGGVLTLAASLDSLNNAITFDGHLRVYDQYFSEPPFGFEIPFMDPFHIPISK